jgi:ADP-heptose:LPS heptosyltransferase
MNQLKQIIKANLLMRFTKKKSVNFDLKNARSVLIFRYDRIGDMIITTPLFRELKNACPEIEISVLASKKNREVIKYNPYIHKVYTNYKNNLIGDFCTLIKLRKKNFDVCIELDHSVINHAIIRHKIIKPKKIISIYKYGRYGLSGVDLGIYDYYTKQDNQSHFSKLLLEILVFFGVSSNSTDYDFFLGKSERKRAISYISSFNECLKIGINIEAFVPEKAIHLNDLKVICKKLTNNLRNVKIILISSPTFISNKNSLINELDINSLAVLYKTETIIDAAALIEQLDIVITPDTSIVHIASAFNIPVISIHENNSESFRLWAPKSRLSKTIFSKSKVGLIDYDLQEVVDSTLSIVKEINQDN